MEIAPRRKPTRAPHRAHSKRSQTNTTKNHKFESFSNRISKLKIEPVRRARRYHFDDADFAPTASHFRSSLEAWKDRNLSENFVNFVVQVEPLSDSLPQILHHEDHILDTLITHIEGGDAISLEPLLNLVAEFAHDLGERFEKYFERTLRAVSKLAATKTEIEVIEWSFNCLAWLFKYLSRLLIPDLRNLFDVMSALLGKQRQKYFITRFAAEAFSSLLIKAARASYRDTDALEIIIEHIVQTINGHDDDKTLQQYQEGLMALFTESIKGVQNGIQSSGAAILQCLLRQTIKNAPITQQISKPTPAEHVFAGVLIALIHHTNENTFSPLLEVTLGELKITGELPLDGQLAIYSRVIITVSGTRRGSRVLNWGPLFEKLIDIIHAMDRHVRDHDDLLISSYLYGLAVSMQYAPLDAVTPRLKLLDTLFASADGSAKPKPWDEHFLAFCNLSAELGSERFRALVLPHLQRFITNRWKLHGDQFSLLISRWNQRGLIQSSSIACPTTWQSFIENSFASLQQSAEVAEGTYQCNSYLTIIRATKFQIEIRDGIKRHLSNLLMASSSSPTLDRLRDQFAYGKGFEFLLEEASTHFEIPSWPSLCTQSEVFCRLELFWAALHRYIRSKNGVIDLEAPETAILKQQLRKCLSSPSQKLRLSALEILVVLLKNDPSLEILDTAISIEQMEISVANARMISVLIRKFGPAYKAIANHTWLSWAVPAFCFGLLHFHLSQAWEESINAITTICLSQEGEQIVSELAFSWLQHANPTAAQNASDDATADESKKISHFLSDFSCSNLMNISDIIEQNSSLLGDAEAGLRSQFEQDHKLAELENGFCRPQALRVLAGVPNVAEKRSRSLVPILLRWASDTRESLNDNEIENALDGEPSIHSLTGGWNRKDQKAMLSLFAQFTNPKVLYKSSEVYEALLHLLTNGDVEIQKSALKAILTWKLSGVKRYEENLTNILDDVKFREQISVFLDVGHADSEIQDADREDLIPVVLRLLYGRIVSRTGLASGKKGQEAKRKAVFAALTRFEEANLQQFLTIALGRLNGIDVLSGDGAPNDIFIQNTLDPRKQYGFLNMLEDMLDTLKSQIEPLVSRLVDPVLYCLVFASRNLNVVQADGGEAEKDENVSLLRKIRQSGLHCLNSLLEYCPTFTWGPYMPTIQKELVIPRLDKLPIETAQSVSGLLVFFARLSSSINLARYLSVPDSEASILDKAAECLTVPSAKDEVKKHVINKILRSLIETINTSESKSPTETADVKACVMKPHAHSFLAHLQTVLKESPSKEVLDAAVLAVVDLAPFIVGSEESFAMLDIASFLLQQPTKRVNPRMKSNLLRILREFIPKFPTDTIGQVFATAYPVVCSLFAFFNDRDNRILLAEVLKCLTSGNADLSEAGELCEDLNSYNPMRIDEPDFDRRAKAFSTINETKYQQFSLEQWRPLVYNMLFFIRDTEELGIRVGASYGLRRFIEAASCRPASEQESLKTFISTAVLAGIKNGIKDSPEITRSEYLSVLAQVVRKFPEWDLIKDMVVLLAGDDEEASFFSNVLHIQQHRRLRALRRLAGEAKRGQLRSVNVMQFFIPVLEPFIFDKADDEGAHNLTAETVTTLGFIVECLDWSQYRSLMNRYITYMKSKTDMEKTIIKLLNSAIDGLNRSCIVKGYIIDGAIEGQSDNEEFSDAMEVDAPLSELARTIPSQEKMAEDMIKHILPTLTQYIHNKDDALVSLRIPVAIALIKLLRLLPQEEFTGRLPGVLMDICSILRSKSQDTRDTTRKTLSDIATLVGPAYFGFILKELRTALPRGYQLHVLSYTMHSILVHLVPTIKPGAIDYCVNDITSIILDDMFGVTGQEKDAEDYVSKMKEVKSNKSYDSMELMAKITSLGHLSQLVRPVDSLLREKVDLKTLKKIDELLRRLGLGVSQNNAIKDRQILMFCYEIIKEASSTRIDEKGRPREDYRVKRYLVKLKSADKANLKGATTVCSYKMVAFALDLVRSVLRRHEELQTPENLAKFLDVIGDSLLSPHESVQLAAVRLLTRVIKLPLQKIDKNGPTYVTVACDIVSTAASTNTELAQAAIKLISAILLERHSLPIEDLKERRLSDLLKRLKPDLEEPDRQGVTFNFLKAVLSRKIIITEVYEIADTVATVMVTNQTATIRDHARSVYVKFILEYPQKKGRFNKQIDFLVSNLSYKHEDGRKSVMECLNLLFNKVGDPLLQEVLTISFSPLVLTLVNDDSQDCREMAAALITRAFEQAGPETTKTMLSLIKKWMDAANKLPVRVLGFRCWSLYFQGDPTTNELPFFIDKFQAILQECVDSQEQESWELLYHGLQGFTKICQLAPTKAFASTMEQLWTNICSCLSFPHAWIKDSAAKLLSHFFEDIGHHNGGKGLGQVPLIGSGGLKLTKERMFQVTRMSFGILKRQDIRDELAKQVVGNLWFLARCFAQSQVEWEAVKYGEVEEGGPDMIESDEETAHLNGHAEAVNEEEDTFEGFDDDSDNKEEETQANAEDEQDKSIALPPQPNTALHQVLRSLSTILRLPLPPSRRAHTPPSLTTKLSSLTLLLKLVSSVSPETLTPSLPSILRPILLLTSPTYPHPSYPNSTLFTQSYKTYTDTAAEVLATIQKNVEPSVFLDVSGAVRKDISRRREERGTKRKLDRVRDPEAYGKSKRRVREKLKEKRKERVAERRGRKKGW